MTEPSEDADRDLAVSAMESAKGAGPIRRLYLWTIHWADTPHALWALFVLAFAEASFFPIPPDVLLIAMALGAPKRALRFAAVCTLGSVVGGLLGYPIGALAFEAVAKPILSVYPGYLDKFEQLSSTFGQHGFLFIFVAALTPIPYKVFTIAAGVCHAEVSIVALLAASIVGRSLRFFAVGGLFRAFGHPIKRFIDRHFNVLTVVFVVLLVLGFVCVRMLAGNANETEAPGDPAPAMPGPAAAGAAIPDGGNRGGDMLSEQARETLLRIARETVSAAVRGEAAPQFDVQEPELLAHQGAFVTLRTHGNLRGCIGRFVADRPLWQIVREMATASATQDMRFIRMQVRPDELADLEIEISVLSPLRRIQDPLNEVELGTHGIYIRRGGRTGCFLPQVATETGWTKEQFLSNCCAGKAGLSPDAWKDPQTEVSVFTAEILHENGA